MFRSHRYVLFSFRTARRALPCLTDCWENDQYSVICCQASPTSFGASYDSVLKTVVHEREIPFLQVFYVTLIGCLSCGVPQPPLRLSFRDDSAVTVLVPCDPFVRLLFVPDIDPVQVEPPWSPAHKTKYHAGQAALGLRRDGTMSKERRQRGSGIHPRPTLD